MASLVKKKVGRKYYYYIVESKRINGKPRIVHQVYLGSVENILKKFQEGGVSTGSEESRKMKVEKEEFEVTEKKKEPEGEDISVDFGELSFGGLFKGIGNFIDLISKMAEEGEEEVTRTGEFKIKGMSDKVKGVYGFTVKTGLGGVPTVEQFGNIRETAKGPVVEEVREPIVDVFDEKDKVLVIAELPGVGEDNIHLEAKGDILTISAEDKDRKYSKEILLPSAVDASTMKTSYKNGILEIIFPKAKL